MRAGRKEKAAPLPAAVVLGADPGTILAAVTPVPDTLSEYQFAGLLRGQRVELADCVIAAAEGAGRSRDRDRRRSLARPIIATKGPMAITPAITIRSSSFPSSPSPPSPCGAIRSISPPITGRPPDEPSILGEALNEVFVPLIRQQFPEIVDFWLPPEGCSYRIAVVSMKKAYPGHAKRVMMAVWSYLRQFMYTKWVIVVDDDINARDWKDVMWAISTRMDPARDITLIENTPIDYLDFASPEIGPGLQDRPRRHQQIAARDQARMGPQDPHGRRGHPHRHRKMAAAGPARQRQADLAAINLTTIPRLNSPVGPNGGLSCAITSRIGCIDHRRGIFGRGACGGLFAAADQQHGQDGAASARSGLMMVPITLNGLRKEISLRYRRRYLNQLSTRDGAGAAAQ